MPRFITAIDIADHYGLDHKTYRQALRDQALHDPRLSFHDHNARWTAAEGSPAHAGMIAVAVRLAGVNERNDVVPNISGTDEPIFETDEPIFEQVKEERALAAIDDLRPHEPLLDFLAPR
jgi:hypothetical protein